MIRTVIKASLPILIITAGVLGMRAFIAAKEEVMPRPPVERSWPVSTARVYYDDIQPQITAFGVIVAGRSVELRSLVAGSVVEVSLNLKDGGTVKSGELLLAVDAFDYETALAEARAQLREASARMKEMSIRKNSEQIALESEQAQLQLRQNEVARRAQLLKRGTVSQKALEDVQLALNQSQQAVAARQQAVAAAEATLEQQRAIRARLDVALRRAERNLERVRLTAPFSGVVSRVGAELGKRVTQNDPVALITDPTDLEARFQLSNAQYGRLLNTTRPFEGERVEVLWTVGDQILSFDGTIERVAPEIDSSRGGVAVYAKIEVATNTPLLRPGAFIEVKLRDRLYPSVMKLPDIALFEDNTIYAVVLKEQATRLQRHKVDVLARTADGVLIRGDIADGAQVVTTRFSEIGPDVKVRVLNDGKPKS